MLRHGAVSSGQPACVSCAVSDPPVGKEYSIDIERDMTQKFTADGQTSDLSDSKLCIYAGTEGEVERLDKE